MVSQTTFVSASTNHEYFSDFAGLSKLPIKEPEEKSEKKVLVPFKPSSGYGYTINPYTTYEPPKGEVKESPRITKSLIFKPAGVVGTYPIRSIIESNCILRPPTWLQQTSE